MAVTVGGNAFMARFLADQKAKGHAQGPLFEVLARIGIGENQNPAAPTAPASSSGMKTVQDFAQEIQTRKVQQPAPAPTGPQVDYAAELAAALPSVPAAVAAKVRMDFNPVASLTACLDEAECPATAKRIYRVLVELALHSVRARGLPQRPDVATFHLPIELLAAHLGIDRTTVWRNLRPLVAAGVLHARDHFDSLKGHSAITGKVWAVSLCPERILNGQKSAVKVRYADLIFPWRDLTRDIERGRTAYALTRTEGRIAAEKANREAKAQELAAARERAAERAAERQAAKLRGEQPLTGRKAAAQNAAETRAQKSRATRPKSGVQQSMESLKAVERGELIKWVLAPFSHSSDDVTLTVARAFSDGLDAIFTLPTLSALPKAHRNAAVEKVAQTLAATFEDSQNFRFWAWLVWQVIRAEGQGQHHAEDVAHILARVLHDVRHDETTYSRTVTRPAALVVNELRNCGLLDALRELTRHRVGGKVAA